MPSSQLPGIQWFAWLRNLTLRIGVLTGVYLSLVLTTWLVIANRVPWSAYFAEIRNLVAAALGALLMLIPILRFLRAPGQFFAAGVVGWGVLALIYLVMGVIFHRLHSRMGPFHFFMLGVVVYGAIAVTLWVVAMVMAARQHHQAIPVARRRSP